MAGMTLNEFAAKKKLALYERLRSGLEPDEGQFDANLLREAKALGSPQMGTTRFEPNQIHQEFIYSAPGQTTVVLSVTLPSPERIVYLPVPNWVIESIWQGDISGSAHFESDAKALVDQLLRELEADRNAAHFGPQAPKRRE